LAGREGKTMEQKAKFIIIGLVIFTLACLFLFIQAFSAKQDLMRERDDLKTENTTLNTKADKLTVSLRNYESRITSLTKDLEDASRKKEDLEKKYEEVNKVREGLSRKLKEQSSQIESSVQTSSSTQEAAPQANDAYWADVLKAKGELELQLTNLRDDFKSLQITNEQAQREKNNLELDLNNLKRENSDLKRQIDYNQKLADSIAQELVREKNDKAQIQDGYKTVKNENASLARQLQMLNERKASLEKKTQELQTNKTELEHRLSEMETMLTERVTQIGGLKQRMDEIKSNVTPPAEEEERSTGKKDAVELPAIVVRPQQADAAGSKPGSADTGLAGKIMAVNRDNNFVIINLGQDAGLKIGDTLKVYRGGRAIAGIEVIQVRRDISACDIKREADAIKIGDPVK
jgi:predicted  nucleic acid-binding Zn-ribbon protein